MKKETEAAKWHRHWEARGRMIDKLCYDLKVKQDEIDRLSGLLAKGPETKKWFNAWVERGRVIDSLIAERKILQGKV